MLVVPIATGSDDWGTILACNDSSIRVISDKGKLLVEQKIGSSVNSLSAGEGTLKEGIVVAYGLQNGTMGVMRVSALEVIILWEITAEDLGRGHRAAVSFVEFAVFKNTNHLVVIRDDSTIEIHSVPDLS
jgi:hypothetical protein